MPRLRPSRAGQRKVVAVIGAGFAGLQAAKRLSGEEGVFVVLVDRKNHHLFQPLLYQVATAGLSPGDIAIPIRAQFGGVENVEVHLGEVTFIDLDKKFFRSGEFEIEFDFLILATGASHSYFDHPEWELFAPGLKSLEQAIEIRRRILSAFEEAENSVIDSDQKALLTFVIVGGGPTGVELAGAIAEIRGSVLTRDFRRINPADASIVLYEGGTRILEAFPPELSASAVRDLEQLGVQVMLNSRVQHIDKSGVQVGTTYLAARNVFWAAGVSPSSVRVKPEPGRAPGGRIRVTDRLTIPGYPQIFVLGDLAHAEEKGVAYPGLAPVAMQQGRYAGEAALKKIQKRSGEPFVFKSRGMMATIGKNRAVAKLGRWRIAGRPAWLLWLFVHLAFLAGFKNRVSVFMQWAWSYMLSKRGARLITDSDWRVRPVESRAKPPESDHAPLKLDSLQYPATTIQGVN